MKIFIIGQTTLHWGRMEFGNIGNFYIIEPFIRELHKVFQGVTIKTTLQMSREFCNKEKVETVPMELYYGWNYDDLEVAKLELEIAQHFAKTGELKSSTPFIDEILEADLVIDFSGDIWGDNADILGENRLFIGLLKDRVAQLLQKKTVMLAGSPGPFNNPKNLDFAKEVYSNFDLVTNREKISTELLEIDGFDTSRTKSLSCPAFLFEACVDTKKIDIIFSKKDRPKVGFILCGWNFIEGPFNKENRNDGEFIQFAEAVEFMSEKLNVDVILMSHSNGFPIPPEKFKLIHGRDYFITKQLHKVIQKRAIAKNVKVLDDVYDAWTTKAILGKFDMLVSGRIHGSVGGLSQNVPTVIIDYGHEPKAHKIKGFSIIIGVQDYLVNPNIKNDLIEKIKACWVNKAQIKQDLIKQIPKVKKIAKENFSILKKLFYK
jgi:colanic acid/amylovoran biosynthesis protein